MDSYIDILFRILDAIDYANDREAFVNKFINNIQIQSIADLIETLPDGTQEILKKELSNNANNPDKVAEIIKKYFTEEQLQKALEAAAKNEVQIWMQAINSTLSDSQKEKLVALSQTISGASQ